METVIVALIPAAIIAVVEFLKRLNKKDYEGCLVIVVAVVVGAAAGLINLKGLDVVTGIMAGLDAVGIHTIATQVSSKV